MEKEPFKKKIYHLYNRGVEKRNIFVDNADRQRFVNGLYFYNDANPVVNTSRLCEVLLRTVGKKEERQKLIEILAFVLMPNHYHLLVKTLVENGLTDFTRKMGTGYTNYFNIKYERVGALFQGKFKSVLIERDEQLFYIPYYIHLNPIELIDHKWKEKEIRDFKKTFDYLKNYRWSSFPDYIGNDNFARIINKKILSEYLGNGKNYKKETLMWLRELDRSEFNNLNLD